MSCTRLKVKQHYRKISYWFVDFKKCFKKWISVNSENQFRDSIAAINLAAEQQQLLEESFNAATDFMKSEDYSNAIKSLNQVLRIDTNYIDAYFNRAVCQQKLNNYKLSIADFKVVYDLDSTRSDALFEQAVYAKENNLFKESEELFTQILELFPSHAKSAYELGVLHYLQKDFRSAIWSCKLSY